jgi:hypothetical protein
VIEIEEPPDIAACATFAVPLVWLWSPRAERWKSFEPLDGDLDVMKRHRCERHGGDVPPPYKQVTFNEAPDPTLVERAHAGAERVRIELERAASKETDNEDHVA